MKVGSKRRRTKAEIEAQKSEDLLKAEALQTKWERLEKMERDLEAANEQASHGKQAQAAITDLIKKGVLRQTSKGAIVPTKAAAASEDANMK